MPLLGCLLRHASYKVRLLRSAACAGTLLAGELWVAYLGTLLAGGRVFGPCLGVGVAIWKTAGAGGGLGLY